MDPSASCPDSINVNTCSMVDWAFGASLASSNSLDVCDSSLAEETDASSESESSLSEASLSVGSYSAGRVSAGLGYSPTSMIAPTVCSSFFFLPLFCFCLLASWGKVPVLIMSTS